MIGDITNVQVRSSALRKELKQWEASFAASHNGHRATREEIKSQPDIAAKYKEYNHLRNITSGKTPLQPLVQTPRKRKSHSTHRTESSPKQRRTIESTPQKTTFVVPDENWPLKDSPMKDVSPSVQRTYVDPTPQKDGRVLGLFDLLPAQQQTPRQHSRSKSMPSQQKARSVLGLIDGNAENATPTKQRCIDHNLWAVDGAQENTPAHKHSRTPQSEGKRFLLDMFVTPSKRRKDIELEQAPQQSTAGLGFSTPTFLRRRTFSDMPLAPIEEEENLVDGVGLGQSPSSRAKTNAPQIKPFGFRKSLGRSLSSLIAEVKKAENARLDDEMDVIHEMEQQENRPLDLNRSQVLPTSQVEDSQGALGPDGTHDSADALESQRQPQTSRVWKKKGAKRQTRRVILRPTMRSKSQVTDKPETSFLNSASSSPGSDDEGDNLIDGAHSAAQSAGTVNIVQETQLPPRLSVSAFDSKSSDSDESNYGISMNDDLDGTTNKHRKSESSTVALTGVASENVPRDSGDMERPGNRNSLGGQLKQAAKRVVNEAAHANYRRLKIRSKGGSTGKRRFGRRG